MHIALRYPGRFSAIFVNGAGFAPRDNPSVYVGDGNTPIPRSIIASMAPEAFLTNGALDREALEAATVTDEVTDLLFRRHSAAAVESMLSSIPAGIRAGIRLRIEYGTREKAFVRRALQEISEVFADYDVQHEVVEYQGNHAFPGVLARDHLAPFFGEVFE